MDETLKFSLTSVLLCLVHIDESMLMAPKSLLLKEHEPQVILEAPSNIDTYTIDGMFFYAMS